ncbi:hypothetical protein GAR06_02148 [Micromonospora saelicesensis]|uniref:Uncharacterized protein n=1 Tax=Micromonospora saelicesensis TaxID=285676 RepID=A0ABX9CEM5_9ACTN|nr:hypothetical protein GAR05_04708 [Micromonospora saelicesensis]RAO48153.1 hypothetical protein GAR06_02148 [Micromonospora saelicesensis]
MTLRYTALTSDTPPAPGRGSLPGERLGGPAVRVGVTRTAGHPGQCVAGGMLCSYWKTLCGSYFALILRSRGKLCPQ